MWHFDYFDPSGMRYHFTMINTFIHFWYIWDVWWHICMYGLYYGLWWTLIIILWCDGWWYYGYDLMLWWCMWWILSLFCDARWMILLYAYVIYDVANMFLDVGCMWMMCLYDMHFSGFLCDNNAYAFDMWCNWLSYMHAM